MPDDHFKASRLTEAGLDAFRDLVDKSRSGVLDRKPSIDSARRQLLKSKACTKTINGAPSVDGFKTFGTRRDAANHAIDVAKACGVSVDPNEVDVGFWAWLALVHLWPLHKSAGKSTFKLRPVEFPFP